MNTSEVILPPSILTKQQYKTIGPRLVKGYGQGAALRAHIRYDDCCGNRHNTFALTGTVRVPGRGEVAGGCLHDDIAEVFPELAPFIKFHGCSSDGPLHYIANTTYLAGERDCNGALKGEPMRWKSAIKFDCSPIVWGNRNQGFIKWVCSLKSFDGVCPVVVEHGPDEDGYKFGPHYTLSGFAAKWHECPFDSAHVASQFLEACRLGLSEVKECTAWGEGKARELVLARSAAIWPEATDAQLSLPKGELAALLLARLPQLMLDFKAAMESLGFVY